MASIDEVKAQRKMMLAECRRLAGHHDPLESEIIESKNWGSVGKDDWNYVLRTLDLTRDVVANLTVDLRHAELTQRALRLQAMESLAIAKGLAARGLWSRVIAWWKGLP